MTSEPQPGRGASSGTAALESDAALFHARLRPHRSLPPAGFRALLIAFGLANVALSVPFALMGAWPVLGFCGLDVALFYFAFRASFAAAEAFEEHAVTFFEVSVAKVSARGARVEWRFNPAFVRMEREVHEEFGVERLRLVSRGRTLEVASFLGREAKAEFAGEFSRALAEARRGPRYS